MDDRVIEFSAPTLRMRWGRGEVSLNDPIGVLDAIQSYDEQSGRPEDASQIPFADLKTYVVDALTHDKASVILKVGGENETKTPASLTMTETTQIYLQLMVWAAEMGKDTAAGVIESLSSE